MATTLCLDFGNTRMKCAVFSGKELKKIYGLENEVSDSLGRIIKECKPDYSLLSSVIDHDPKIENLLDRLALVVAACDLFPQSNNLVIGLGSAITYNFVNKHHAFLGGGISPGMEMRLKSLQLFTAKLPLVKPDWNFPLVGYDTRTNILSGVILGMAKEIDGMIDAYQEKYTNFNVLLSGGDGQYFTRFLKKEIFADPDLIFKGLNAISIYNR